MGQHDSFSRQHSPLSGSLAIQVESSSIVAACDDQPAGSCSGGANLRRLSSAGERGGSCFSRLLGGGRWQVLLNLHKAMFGSGFMALTHVFADMGLQASAIAFLICSGVGWYTMDLVLVSYQIYVSKLQDDQPRPRTWAELTLALLGKRWRFAVESSIVLLQSAYCVGMVIIILRAAETIFGVQKTIVAVCLLPPLVGLAMLEQLRQLWFTSALGLIVFVVVIMIGSVWTAMSAGMELHWLPGDDEKKHYWLQWIEWVGSIMYSIEIVNHVLPNATSLDRPQEMHSLLALVMTVFCFIVGSWLMLTASLGLGSEDMVINALPAGGSKATINAAVALNLLVTLPLSLFPAAQLLDRLCFAELEQGERKGCVRLLLRPVLMILVVVTGTSVDSLGALTGFVGSTLMLAMGFIVPSRLYAAADALNGPGRRFRKRRVLNWALSLAAMAVAVIQCSHALGLMSWLLDRPASRDVGGAEIPVTFIRVLT